MSRECTNHHAQQKACAAKKNNKKVAKKVRLTRIEKKDHAQTTDDLIGKTKAFEEVGQIKEILQDKTSRKTLGIQNVTSIGNGEIMIVLSWKNAKKKASFMPTSCSS